MRLGDPEATERVYLAYALVTQGPEYQTSPSVLLDDWGNQVGSLNLYARGDSSRTGCAFRAPRCLASRRPARRLNISYATWKLFGRFPVYAFSEAGAPAASGVLVRDVLVPDAATAGPQLTEPPQEIVIPLREGQLRWWRINLHQAGLEFIE